MRPPALIFKAQMHGGAERAIHTVKRQWRKSEDQQLALLDYRTTPLEGLNLSPAQLLMGRRPRNTLPASKELLRPGNHDTQKVKKHFDEQKAKQKSYYDHRRGVKGLPPLDKGTPVCISPLPGTNNWLPGKVVTHYNKPRSYVVQAGNQLYRRNRKHLRVSTEVANATRDDKDTDLHVDKTPRRRILYMEQNTAHSQIHQLSLRSRKPVLLDTSQDREDMLWLPKNLTCNFIMV